MPHGKICYLEIPANRPEDSADFYGAIFNWKVRKRGDGELAFDDTGGRTSAHAPTSWSTTSPTR